jgi:hypothetical protein
MAGGFPCRTLVAERLECQPRSGEGFRQENVTRRRTRSDRRFWRQSLAACPFYALESQRQDVSSGLWRHGRIAYPDFAALGKGDGRVDDNLLARFDAPIDLELRA